MAPLMFPSRNLLLARLLSSAADGEPPRIRLLSHSHNFLTFVHAPG